MQVILKATTGCNGSCRYCAAAPEDGGTSTLPTDRLGSLFEAFLPWLQADATRRLGFLWHGGEPMLRGLPFFERAAAEQARVFGPHVDRVTNRIQSNLTLLTDAWLPFLKTFVKSIGTSYDPVDGIRGLTSGAPLAPRWLRAVESCRAAGIPVGVVYVVHRLSLDRGRDLYHYFRNLDSRGRMRFNPLYPEGRAAHGANDLSITPSDYGRFLVEVARAWWDDGRRTAVRPLSEWYAAWQDPGARRSCDSAGSCHTDLLGIGPDGAAWGCGRFADRGVDTWRLGNIYEDDLEILLSHPVRTELGRRGHALRDGEGECAACRYWNVCRGGCPAMAALLHGNPMRRSPYCEGRRMVFDFIAERLGQPATHAAPCASEAVP